MIVLGVILGIILFILLMIGISGTITERNRKKRCKSWKVGDKLILSRGNDYYQELQKNNKSYAKLEGWTLDHLYINCGGGYVSKVSWLVLSANKSDDWRKNYDEAKKVMGCNPNFKGDVNDSNSVGGIYEGKPIDTMNEIECEVYLKMALEEEDYNTSELIKKRMEKFR